MNILVTGTAGFIGFSVSFKLLKLKHTVIGLDNLNSYYDKNLKLHRLKILKKYKNFIFKKIDISKKKKLNKIKTKKIDFIIHLAAQAGVRYSLEKPEEYLNSNIIGTFNILEFCKERSIKKLIFSSSSSVYGNNKKIPFKEHHNADEPLQFYASTKKSCEAMIYSYSKLYDINSTVLRFFTVYGPFGRPDMAIYKFTKNIINKKKIDVFNKGNHSRDFTYIEDVVESIILLINKKNKTSLYKVFNICSFKKVSIMKIITFLEKITGKKAKIRFKKKQIGDMIVTYGNNSKLRNYIGYLPKTNLYDGLKKYVIWFKNYNK
tara:strand:+ start:1393 stop:2349 length:957 start_codon:yes stop_codon:yes gene_type:complete